MIETLGVIFVVAGCLVWLLAIAANHMKHLPECQGREEENNQ